MGYVYDHGVSVVSVRDKIYEMEELKPKESNNILMTNLDDEVSDSIEEDLGKDNDDVLEGDEENPDEVIKDDKKNEETIEQEIKKKETKENTPIEEVPKELLKESLEYSYNIDDYNAVNSALRKSAYAFEDDIDIDSINKNNMNPIFDDEDDSIPNLFSENIEYIDEKALTAKQRRAIEDKEFELPRLRKYPLIDKKRVNQAIRFFGYTKSEEDKKTLAKNIIKKYNEYNMTTKVGPNNALYNYIPDNMKHKPLREPEEMNESNTIFTMDKKKIDNKFYVPLYVVLTKTTTFFGNAIRKVTNEPYNHASIAFTSTLDKMYSFASSGFKIESIADNDLDEYILYVKFVPINVSKKIKETLADIFNNKDITKYNTVGILRYLLNIPKDNVDKFKMFCSEFVAYILELGNTKLDKSSSLTAPMDLVSEKLYLVSSGKASLYNKKETDNNIKKIILNKKVKKYLSENSIFYNNLIYNPNFSKEIIIANKMDILEFFHPNVKYGIANQFRMVLGGICFSDDIHNIDYDKDSNCVNLTIIKFMADYKAYMNFYMKDSFLDENNPEDIFHIKYCMELYQIIHKMLYLKFYTLTQLNIRERQVISDWKTLVNYYYNLLSIETNDAKKEVYKQLLFDIFWDWRDDPKDENIISNNILGFCYEVGIANDISECVDLIDKEETYQYLLLHLTKDTDVFLLPAQLKYPIINKHSIQKAMDYITNIAPEDRKEYSINLNKMYCNFKCDFTISTTHPYAKFALSKMINGDYILLNEEDTYDDSEIYELENEFYYTVVDMKDNDNLLDGVSKNKDILGKPTGKGYDI